jgi:hypothetical protein
MTKFNPYEFNLQEALKLIQEDFFNFYRCPECQKEATNGNIQQNRINKEINIPFHGCDCLRLRLYNHGQTDRGQTSLYKKALILHVTDTIQWIAFNTYGFKSDGNICFKVVEGADRFAVEQLIIHKGTLMYDYIPSFVFKPLIQMTNAMETLITFQ